jgi:hypothetical protein
MYKMGYPFFIMLFKKDYQITTSYGSQAEKSGFKNSIRLCRGNV